MKKTIGIVMAAVFVVGGAFAADVVTKYTIPTMVSEINTGFAARDASDVTNVTGLAAGVVTNVTNLGGFATNIVAVAPVTNVVIQTYVPTFILDDGTTNTTALVTNIVVQTGAAPTLQTVTPALQKSTPAMQRR